MYCVLVKALLTCPFSLHQSFSSSFFLNLHVKEKNDFLFTFVSFSHSRSGYIIILVLPFPWNHKTFCSFPVCCHDSSWYRLKQEKTILQNESKFLTGLFTFFPRLIFVSSAWTDKVFNSVAGARRRSFTWLVCVPSHCW